MYSKLALEEVHVLLKENAKVVCTVVMERHMKRKKMTLEEKKEQIDQDDTELDQLSELLRVHTTKVRVIQLQNT